MKRCQKTYEEVSEDIRYDRLDWTRNKVVRPFHPSAAKHRIGRAGQSSPAFPR
jgi:hypothetical protein